MTQEEFEARVSMAYEGREQWDAFLDRVWLIHTSELPHWISVADELPKDKEIVLVLTPDATFWCDVATYVNGVEWLETFNGWTVPTKVTHWMHLPAAPTKEGNQ